MAQEYPGATRDRQGEGGEQEADNQRLRREQAEKISKDLGIDTGNLESFISGRAPYEEYLADQRARTTNTPGDENGDGQDDRTPAQRGDIGPSAGQPSSMQSWTGSPGGAQGQNYAPYLEQQNTLLQQLFDRQVAEQSRIEAEKAARDAELKTRQDALYAQLQGRAQQSTALSTEDPIIKAQVDNYRAESERALRNVRSDAAEGRQRLRPTQDRMATERVSQGVASMQSELMARELQSRRAEISDALSSMGSMLSTDQQAGLQRELASLDNMIRQQQIGISGRDLDLRRELGLGDLALGQGRLGLDTELGRGDLSLRGELGRGALSNELLRTMLQNQQFYGDLGQQSINSDRNYDLTMRGRLGNRI